MTAFATTIRQSHEIIYINESMTMPQGQQEWQGTRGQRCVEVEVQRYRLNFEVDRFQWEIPSPAPIFQRPLQMPGGWFEIYKDLQQSWQSCSISIHFIPFLL